MGPVKISECRILTVQCRPRWIVRSLVS